MTEPNLPRKRNKELTNELRKTIYYQLILLTKDGALKRGSYAVIAAHHGVAPRQVSRAYLEMVAKVKAYREAHIHDQENLVLPDSLFHNRRSNCGKEKTYDRDQFVEDMQKLPIKERETYRGLAKQMGVSKTTLHRFCHKEKLLRKWRASLKPSLTENNKMERMEYALSMIQTPTATRSPVAFKDALDMVHVDEKWFYVIRDGASYLLVFDEEPPLLTTRHKKKISKVMFLCAVARPRWVNHVYWDGKIGIWPVGKEKAALKDSVNRPAGTIEWENETIDTEKYMELITDKVIPAIVAKWPSSDWNNDNKKVYIQQDGAPSHKRFVKVGAWDEIVAELNLNGKIQLVTQPANSPDLNILDLGFFRSLQAQYYSHNPRNEMDIIRFVKQAFDRYDPKVLNRIWLTHQGCLNEIIKCNGGNDYKIPHMNKDGLESQGELPLVLPVTADLDGWLVNDDDGVFV